MGMGILIWILSDADLINQGHVLNVLTSAFTAKQMRFVIKGITGQLLPSWPKAGFWLGPYGAFEAPVETNWKIISARGSHYAHL